jgi:hypothetical protein
MEFVRCQPSSLNLAHRVISLRCGIWSAIGGRLCENALGRRRRIVFSIAFFRKKLPVQSTSTSTKTRWKFYTQVGHRSFHTAWGHSGLWRAVRPADLWVHGLNHNPAWIVVEFHNCRIEDCPRRETGGTIRSAAPLPALPNLDHDWRRLRF